MDTRVNFGANHAPPAREGVEADRLRHLGASVGKQPDVTFPARQYSVNGERRSFALLRPIVDTTAQNKIRELILEAFQEYEERAAVSG